MDIVAKYWKIALISKGDSQIPTRRIISWRTDSEFKNGGNPKNYLAQGYCIDFSLDENLFEEETLGDQKNPGHSHRVPKYSLTKWLEMDLFESQSQFGLDSNASDSNTSSASFKKSHMNIPSLDMSDLDPIYSCPY